jgi:hypothetical protein
VLSFHPSSASLSCECETTAFTSALLLPCYPRPYSGSMSEYLSCLSRRLLELTSFYFCDSQQTLLSTSRLNQPLLPSTRDSQHRPESIMSYTITHTTGIAADKAVEQAVESNTAISTITSILLATATTTSTVNTTAPQEAPATNPTASPTTSTPTSSQTKALSSAASPFASSVTRPTPPAGAKKSWG